MNSLWWAEDDKLQRKNKTFYPQKYSVLCLLLSYIFHFDSSKHLSNICSNYQMTKTKRKTSKNGKKIEASDDQVSWALMYIKIRILQELVQKIETKT